MPGSKSSGFLRDASKTLGFVALVEGEVHKLPQAASSGHAGDSDEPPMSVLAFSNVAGVGTRGSRFAMPAPGDQVTIGLG